MLRTRFRTRARFIPALSGGGAFSITNSLRFNDNDSAYLSRTPSVAGDRKTWTISAWVKRGNIGIQQKILNTRKATNVNPEDLSIMEFTSGNAIRYASFGSSVDVETTALLRDISGWYHIVFVFDSTNATSTDRIKIYVNGVRLTAFTTYTAPTLNQDSAVNNTELHTIGGVSSSQNLDGYLADIYLIDGQALTADDFGQIDATTGEWSPKKYSGTYGTNGFYLPFNGNANDDSGNGNNWTENNLASTDYMIDTPTNNFSTWNPLNNIQSTSLISFSEGNLLRSESTATNTGNTSTIAPSSGKWYWESYIATSTNTNNYAAVGRLGSSYLGVNRGGAKVNLTGTASTYGGTGTLIGVAIDLDAGTFDIYENGALDSSLTFTPTGEPFSPAAIDGTTTTTTFALIANFGADSSFAGNKTRQGNTDSNGKGDFYYTPPTGYLALCTDNLPEPTIVDSESHFNVVTYTGTGTTLNVTGVGFQPDLVWMKRRDSANTHDLIDVVRGDTARLFPNLTDAELSDVTFSFDSDGFSPDPTKANENAAGGSYVAWCWKAGGTAVTNTDGTITSQVSANVDAGFSIVGYTGTGANATVGHGLGAAPAMIIGKSRDSALSWQVYHASLGATELLTLNSTAAASTNSTSWNNTEPTSSVFSLGTGTRMNASGDANIAYCFAEVEGFSKFGSYVGNGSADGPFVYTGFKPAFVLYKRAVGGTGNWILADNEREGYNWDNPTLYPNLTNAESSGSSIDILSNGFKVNNAVAGSDHNASGSTYIYMAFAEHPFKEALAR